MFERYTERARRVIFFARYEASQLGSNSIETEHLLLGRRPDVGKAKEPPLPSEYTRDPTEAAARCALDPLVGRGAELARVVQVLCRRTRNKPVLFGEPGVGKSALVAGLANKIVQG